MIDNSGKKAAYKPPSYRRMHLHIGNDHADTYQELLSYCGENGTKPTPIIWEAIESYLKRNNE